MAKKILMSHKKDVKTTDDYFVKITEINQTMQCIFFANYIWLLMPLSPKVVEPACQPQK